MVFAIMFFAIWILAFMVLLLFGKLLVMSAQKDIYSQKGKHNDHKSYNCHDGRSPAPPSRIEAEMQQSSINQPCTNGKYLFEIPTPETPPYGFCIDKSCNQAKGQQDKPGGDTGIADIIQKIQRR
jgi:hypothetical protein